ASLSGRHRTTGTLTCPFSGRAHTGRGTSVHPSAGRSFDPLLAGEIARFNIERLGELAQRTQRDRPAAFSGEDGPLTHIGRFGQIGPGIRAPFAVALEVRGRWHRIHCSWHRDILATCVRLAYN